MPYEVMVKQAHTIIDEMPHEKIEYVIGILKNFENENWNKSVAEKKSNLKNLKKFCGKVNLDIDLDSLRARN